MSHSNSALVVLVTCASAAEARRIARSAVAKRLAACGNVLSGQVRSLYRWKGKVETAKESLLILKTTRAALKELEAEVKRLHSYDVPEFVAIEIVSGSRDYLAWLTASVFRLQ